MHFEEQRNFLSLVNFLKRTILIDVSMKVLSLFYVNLTRNSYICGKLVYNQLAKIYMQSLMMLNHSLLTADLPHKDLLIVKNLVINAVKQKSTSRESDLAFLKNSQFGTDLVQEDLNFERFPELRMAIKSKETYLDLLSKKHECYVFK